MLTLRDYQKELVENNLRDLRAGCKNIINVSPTGSGKTISFIAECEAIINDSSLFEKDKDAILILSHLSLLTDQTFDKFKKFSSVNCGILQADRMPSLNCDVIISTMQSSRNENKMEYFLRYSRKNIRYIIVDESHRRFSASYSTIFDMFPDAQVIDYTATPFKNKKLATGFYDSISFQISMQELIDKKYLVPPKLKKIAFDSKDTATKAATIFKMYSEYEMGKKAIVFMKTKEECQLVSDLFVSNKINASVVTDHVVGKTREHVFNLFENGQVDVLISVSVLEAGFDSPKCSAVFMFETKSPVSYMQKIGRALRPWDSLLVRPEHPKQSANIYYFGTTPEIESGAIDKLHGEAIKPKKKEDCKTLDELLEFAKDNDIIDEPEFGTAKELFRARQLAREMNMESIARLINEQNVSTQFLMRLAENVGTKHKAFNDNKYASDKQMYHLKELGIDKKVKANEANYLLSAKWDKPILRRKTSGKHIINEGVHKGKHVSQVPWAYKSWILKNRPDSPVAKTIKTFHKKI